MIDYRKLRTVRQIVEESKAASGGGEPAFSEGSLRWLIFHACQNGLDEALVRVGRRVFIDEDAFNAWLERGRKPASDCEGAIMSRRPLRYVR